MKRILNNRRIIGILVALCAAIPAFAQLPPGQVFADVPSTDPEYAATTTLFQLGISVGCDPTPDFCPTVSLNRGDMAAFIIKAWSARAFNDPDGFQTDAPA